MQSSNAHIAAPPPEVVNLRNDAWVCLRKNSPCADSRTSGGKTRYWNLTPAYTLLVESMMAAASQAMTKSERSDRSRTMDFNPYQARGSSRPYESGYHQTEKLSVQVNPRSLFCWKTVSLRAQAR